MLPPDVCVVCLSTIDWSFSWQPNQEIMSRLAAEGTPVLYVEPTGARAIRAGDWKRAAARIRHALLRGRPARQGYPNLTIYPPLVLPFPHAPAASAVNLRIVEPRIRSWIERHHRGSVVFWVFLASPLTLALIDRMRPHAVVYQLMGDVTASRPIPAIARAERGLLTRADLVFANSLSLVEHARRHARAVHLFRAGVDVDAFAGSTERGAQVPDELTGLQGPVAGYIGSIHTWMDLELLGDVAARLPDWHFVMIGTVLRDVGMLQHHPNVHWLGQRLHHELGRYVRHFTAGIIPYVLDAYTASAYPGKLNEYLAVGKPVVATPLPELVAYNAEFGGVVRLAGAAEAFAAALQDAYAEGDRRVDAYRAAAAANSWETQVRRMEELIGEVLVHRAAVRREAVP